METLQDWFASNPEKDVQSCKKIFVAWCYSYARRRNWQMLDWIASGYDYDRCIVVSHLPFFDIVAFRWPPGSTTPFHRYQARGCLQLVITGQLQETRASSSIEKPAAVSTIRSGSPQFISKEHSHSVSNVSNREAISLHLYAPAGYAPVFEERIT